MSTPKAMMRWVPGAWTALLLLLVVMVCPGRAGAASKPGTPEQVVERFYDAYLKLGVSGLPDEKQMQTLGPFLSYDLQGLLTAARRKQAVAIRRHPDEKPPWGDGDLFSSLFEGAQRFEVGSAALTGSATMVPVRLESREGGSVTRWTDTFVLAPELGGWHIADVKMGGPWAFKQGATLRKTLGAR